jgi:hypothetical protein
MADQPSGGGGGYTIPVSLSAADSFSVPQNQTSPTQVIFGPYKSSGGSTGDIRGGMYDTEQSPVMPTTATASTALGGNSNAAAQIGTGASDSKSNWILAAAIVAAAFIFKRKG